MNPARLVTGPVARLGAAVQNGLEVVRFGGLDTGEEHAPYDVAASGHHYRLRRYFAGDGPATGRPAALLVPPMMLAAEVWDVAPASSAVRSLHALGIDPWVVDFGAPDKETGGLERTLTDHVLAVSDAVEAARRILGRDVHLAGYSQGGMFCYQTAAYRRSDGIASLVCFGSPVDTHHAIPFGLPAEFVARAAGVVADSALARQALPAWASRIGFRLLDPVKSVRNRVEFLLQLHDRERLLPRESQRRFLDNEGWVAWAGPAIAELLKQFVVHNRMLSGGFVIGDRLVTLADISSPVLAFVGEVDDIAPPPAVRAVTHAAPNADIYEVTLRAGHFGLVVGSTSNQVTWPTTAAWLHWREGTGERPENVAPMEFDPDEQPEHGGAAARLAYGLEIAGGAGAGATRVVMTAANRTARTVRTLAAEAAGQLPRLMRLEQIQPRTRISMGLLLDEAGRRAPEDVCFIFEGRAHTQAEANRRIDNVVRGLLSIGVRQGEHVGVLMRTRPSMLMLVSALNRLGAVTVLLRPDGDHRRELRLGQVARLISDPDHAKVALVAARQAGLDPVYVLGGGPEPRDLGPGVVDLERIDPEAVVPPAWYRPDPGRARDLAFILFSGAGADTQAKRITNHRWALSAFGTASSAALGPADTIYSLTPLHHASGLMTSIGGAVAGGARVAFATSFDVDTFWNEVRRYGVTVVSYTWTSLLPLLDAPPHTRERHHPIRLFLGSGMPRGLWQRLTARFSPARVLEFYASTEGDAVLVNLTGAKPGSKGRRLPGSAAVRIAAYDLDAARLVVDDRGYAVRCETGEVGMLLARVRDKAEAVTGTPLRGVFARDDIWQATGDLFRRDEDGDFWLVDSVSALVRTRHGVVPAFPVQDALGDLAQVDLAVLYGLPSGEADGDAQLAAAAVTLRPGSRLTADDVTAALADLPSHECPDLVHVVPDIPVTTWHRPATHELRAAGLPRPGRTAWRHDARRGRYVPLTAAARADLAGG